MSRLGRIEKLEAMFPEPEDPEVVDKRLRERVERFRQLYAKNPKQLDMLPPKYRSAMLELFSKCPAPDDGRG